MATKNSKNSELQAEFAKQIESGKPFVFAKNEPTVGAGGKTYQTLFIAQAKKANQGLNEMFLGWNTRIVRATRNALAELSPKFPVGMVLDGLSVQSVESLKPKFEGQNPRINPSTGEIITSGGQPVYEHTELVRTEDLKDFRFERQTVTAPTPKAVNAAEAKSVSLTA